MSAEGAAPRPSRVLKVFLVVGEESGDQLGASLMQALRSRLHDEVQFAGVGGAAMAREGLSSRFPLADVALMGFLAVARGWPKVFARIRETAGAVLAEQPDVLVIIDSPDFTHRVARRVRANAPGIPIVNYVSPSVWAWRPGRAQAMRAYVDHVLALLPFEPAAHARLGGPACTFVGHPVVEKIALLRPNEQEARRRLADPPVLLILPGSRRTEIRRLLAPFGETVARLQRAAGPLELVLPTLPHLHAELAEAIESWPIRPRLVTPDGKHAAFRIARAALAASGTVTLELALSGVPTVAAYRAARIEAAILRRLVRLPSVILPNLVLGENVVPEFLQEDCTPDRLAAALTPLLADTAARRLQLAAFSRLDQVMAIGRAVPSAKAAEIVVAVAQNAPARSNAQYR
jgi:lipid-A-disaccharide synthase